MPNAVMKQSFRSSSKSTFHLLLTLTILAVLGYGGLWGGERRYKQQATDIQTTITTLQQQIETLGDTGEYEKLNTAREIVQKTRDLQRSEHIPRLISMLQQLQNADYLGNDAIVLSDFSISLEEIELKGTVTNLLLLYHSSPRHNYVSLIETFEGLEFIDQLSIKEYENIDGNIEFVLTATVSQPDDLN